MSIPSGGFSSIDQIRDQLVQQGSSRTKSNGVVTESGQTFQEILQSANGVRFSKHASERLESRNIQMSDSQKERLSEATNQAGEKGIKESLVMVDNLAFIVNVKSKTVVTAVSDMKQAAFTNIDGVIIN